MLRGDVLVVTKLDRLARSLPDARDIVAEHTAREITLSLGGSVHDPSGSPRPSGPYLCELCRRAVVW